MSDADRVPNDPDLEQVEDEAQRKVDLPPGSTPETPQHRASRDQLNEIKDDEPADR